MRFSAVSLVAILVLAACSSDDTRAVPPENNLPACAPACSSHARCAVIGATPKCLCDTGHEGQDCASCSTGYRRDANGACLRDPCDKVTCGGHGQCGTIDNTAVCVCLDGYAGADCGKCDDDSRPLADGTCVLDLCVGKTCSSHGRCIEEGAEARCLCGAGYQGPDCAGCAAGYRREGEKCLYDPCLDFSCHAHGTCAVNESGEAVCACAAGYRGTRCEQCAEGYRSDAAGGCVLDSCHAIACSSRGACAEEDGVAKCFCQVGYAGIQCESCAAGHRRDESGACVPDACWGVDCTGHGTCADQNGIGVCSCQTGYGGVDCERCTPGYLASSDGRWCVVDACYNKNCGRGACEQGGGLCVCDAGYARNGGGVCADCTAAYRRQSDGTCAPDACYNEACSGHGTCTGGVCACATGYAGTHCEACAPGHAFDPSGQCRPTACLNHPGCGHGACAVVAGAAVCRCDAGYFGDACNDCADGFMKDVDGNTCVPDRCFGVNCGPGTCEVQNNAPACTCPAGYGGDGCARCALGYRMGAAGKCDPTPSLDTSAEWPQFGYDNYNRFQSPYAAPADLAEHMLVMRSDPPPTTTLPSPPTSAGFLDADGVGLLSTNLSVSGSAVDEVRFINSANVEARKFTDAAYGASLSAGYGVAVRGGYLLLGKDLKLCFRKVASTYDPLTGNTTVSFPKVYCAAQPVPAAGDGYAVRVTRDADAMSYVAPFGNASPPASVITAYRDSLAVAWTYDVRTAAAGDFITTRLIAGDDGFLYAGTNQGLIVKLDRRTGALAARSSATVAPRVAAEIVALALGPDGYLVGLAKDNWHFRMRAADGQIVKYKDLTPTDGRTYEGRALALGTDGFYAAFCTPAATNGQCSVGRFRADTAANDWSYLDTTGNAMLPQYWGPLTVTRDNKLLVLANARVLVLSGANGQKVIESERVSLWAGTQLTRVTASGRTATATCPAGQVVFAGTATNTNFNPWRQGGSCSGMYCCEGWQGACRPGATSCSAAATSGCCNAFCGDASVSIDCIGRAGGPRVQPQIDVTGGLHFGVAGLSTSSQWNSASLVLGGTQTSSCSNIGCSGHGSCQLKYGLATCACDPGYLAQGLDCTSP